ncbi:hypothetical protein D3C72_1271800 [compost metagenome]
MDDQLALATATMVDRNRGTQHFGQLGFQRGDIGLLHLGHRLRTVARHLAGGERLRTTLDLAHRPALIGRFLGQLAGQFRSQGQQRAGVPHLQPARFQQQADGDRQLQQAQQVGHRCARATDGLGGLGMGQRELADQPLQGLGLFERIEVFALDVLDQRHRDDGAVFQLAHHHRHFVQASQLRGAPAAFAGHDLEAVRTQLAHQDGLDHALGLDRFGQLGELGLIHVAARLVLARLQLAHRQLAQHFTGQRLDHRRAGLHLADRALGPQQGVQAAAEATLLGGRLAGHQTVSTALVALLRSLLRRMISPARPR